MATPSEKHPAIESLLGDRRDCILNDLCNVCKLPAGDFKDALSEKEYTISGMCQECQDGIFGAGEE